jgi:hypothetical protein
MEDTKDLKTRDYYMTEIDRLINKIYSPIILRYIYIIISNIVKEENL